MVVFYRIWKKYNETQLTKKLNGCEQSKNENSSSPITFIQLPRKLSIFSNTCTWEQQEQNKTK